MKTKINSLIILAFGLILFSCKKENSSPLDTRLKDIDGNVYDTVVIGTQVWMKENLRTTHYNDGSSIPYLAIDSLWKKTSSGAYAIYENNKGNDSIYGKLYNWFAVNTGKLAPAGWHVPSDSEFITLTTYLGGVSIAGGAMKATSLWVSPNTDATNSSGFTGLPAGYRTRGGLFGNIGSYGYFWSSTSAVGCALLYNGSGAIRSFNDNENGFSVRCVRD